MLNKKITHSLTKICTLYIVFFFSEIAICQNFYTTQKGLSFGLNQKIQKNLGLLKSNNLNKKKVAIARLGALKAKEAVPELLAIIQTDTINNQLKRLSINALGNIKDLQALEVLQHNLFNTDKEISKASIRALLNFEDLSVSHQIIKLATSESNFLKVETLAALATTNFWLSNLQKNTQFLKSLENNISNSNEEIQEKTIILLGLIKNEKHHKLLHSLVHSTSSNRIKIQLVKAMVRYQKKSDISSIKTLVNSDNMLHCIIAGSLVKLGDFEAINNLKNFLNSDSIKIRMEAIYQLASIRNKESLELLKTRQLLEKEPSLQRLLTFITTQYNM